MTRLSSVGLVVLVLFASAACQSGAASAPALSDADRDTLRQNENAFAKALNSQNFTAAASNYTSDASMMEPNAEAVNGRDAIQKWMASLPPISDFKLDIVDLDGRGDLAYIRGNYSLKMTPPGAAATADRGKFIEIWSKQPDGSWKMKWDIFNSDLPAIPATKS